LINGVLIPFGDANNKYGKDGIRREAGDKFISEIVDNKILEIY